MIKVVTQREMKFDYIFTSLKYQLSPLYATFAQLRIGHWQMKRGKEMSLIKISLEESCCTISSFQIEERKVESRYKISQNRCHYWPSIQRQPAKTRPQIPVTPTSASASTRRRHPPPRSTFPEIDKTLTSSSRSSARLSFAWSASWPREMLASLPADIRSAWPRIATVPMN